MKILYLITRTEAAGAQTHLLELLRGFREEHEPVLASGEDDFLAEKARELGIETVIFPDLVQPIDPDRDLRAYRAIRNWLRGNPVDLLHAHSSKAGLLGRLAAHRTGTPAVFTAHGWGFTPGTPARRRLVALAAEKLAGRLGGRIITVSEFDRAEGIRARIAPPERIVTVHNAVADLPGRAVPAGGDPVEIVMVARFTAQKDQATLLRAAGGLEDNFRLTLVGDGATRDRCERLARELGIAGRTRFAGTRLDMGHLLAGAHIFVLTTNYEGMPMSILEAMRAGLPVVATGVGGVREAVEENVTGYLARRGDPQDVREKLAMLLENPGRRTAMGAAGRRRYEERFTVDRMLEETARAYDEALSRHG